MGFINCNGSFYSPLTAEVCSWWLADYMNGYFNLPSKTEMYAEINNELTWMKNNFLSVTASGNCVGSFCLRHIEELIQDMAANNSLVIWDKIAKIMLPLDISIYAQVRQKLKSMRLQN